MGVSEHQIEILNRCVLDVLYEARNEDPLSLETIHEKLNIQHVKARPKNMLIEGILAYLFSDGHISYTFSDGHISYTMSSARKITEEGISIIEG